MATIYNRLRSFLGIAPKVPEETPEVFGFYAIYATIFLYTLSYGLLLYLASTFIETYAGKDLVGLVYAAGAVVSLLCLISMPPLLRRIGNRRAALLLIALMTLVLFGLSFFESVFAVIPLFILYQALYPVIIFNLDLFLESFSRDASTGSIRGYYLTLINLALILALIASGFVMAGASYPQVFFYAGITLIPALLLIFFSLRTFQDPLYVNISYKDAIARLREQPNIRKSLFIQFLPRFFFIWLTIYLPIYLFTEVGIPFSQILLIIFPISVVPYLFVPIIFGKLADKLHNERKMLMIGFFIVAIDTALISFITTDSILVWSAVLLAGRIGISLVETMSGTYFYKHVDASNVNLISMFRALRPVANMIAPVAASLILIVFGLTYQYLFLILGIIMLVGIPLSMTLDRTGGLKGW